MSVKQSHLAEADSRSDQSGISNAQSDDQTNSHGEGVATLVHSIGFAVWFGGLIILVSVVALNAGLLVQHHPEIAGNSATKDAVLNGVVGASFRMFNLYALISGGLMLLGDYMHFKSENRLAKQVTLVCAGATILALATVAAQRYFLFPAMDSAQEIGNMAKFDRLHSVYEIVGSVQLMLLTIVGGMNAFRVMRANDRD